MSAVIFSFLTGTLVTLLVGFISKAVASFLAPPRFQAVAAFSVTLGFSLRHFAYSGPADLEAVSAVAAALGSLVALYGLWYWFFKRASAAGLKDESKRTQHSI